MRRPTPHARRTFHSLLVFVGCVLIVDALVGDKGLLETMRARREYRELAASLTALQEENDRLREHARQLEHDPTAVEEIARREFGLVRPGELLFIVNDVPLPSERVPQIGQAIARSRLQGPERPCSSFDHRQRAC